MHTSPFAYYGFVLSGWVVLFDDAAGERAFQAPAHVPWFAQPCKLFSVAVLLLREIWPPVGSVLDVPNMNGVRGGAHHDSKLPRCCHARADAHVNGCFVAKAVLGHLQLARLSGCLSAVLV